MVWYLKKKCSKKYLKQQTKIQLCIYSYCSIIVKRSVLLSHNTFVLQYFDRNLSILISKKKNSILHHLINNGVIIIS